MSALTGLSSASAERSTCDARSGSCHLCGDEAVVGYVMDMDPDAGTATVAFDEHRATIALDLVEVSVGDQVLVHLGFAIERVDA